MDLEIIHHYTPSHSKLRMSSLIRSPACASSQWKLKNGRIMTNVWKWPENKKCAIYLSYIWLEKALLKQKVYGYTCALSVLAVLFLDKQIFQKATNSEQLTGTHFRYRQFLCHAHA